MEEDAEKPVRHQRCSRSCRWSVGRSRQARCPPAEAPATWGGGSMTPPLNYQRPKWEIACAQPAALYADSTVLRCRP